MSSADTIFALATPPGKSGVAIIRLSGPRALSVLQQLSGLQNIARRHAHYVTLRTVDTVIDRGLALYFPQPNSFTGEDVVELQLHGSLAVIRQILETLAATQGMRPAEPGEFSRRAFINGKMDLTEAEGLADLIAAETIAQKTQAMRQMQGGLSHYYDRLRTGIIRSLAHLEAYIDFPDEDIPDSVLTTLHDDLIGLQHTITHALQDDRRGERLRDGIHIVILGAPNAGKSSLLNALARRDAAIVSTRAGTTRDVIEVHMDIAGFPVILADTAGIRDTSDDIEEEGVRRALSRAQSADIKLILFDGAEWPHKDTATEALLDKNSVAVITKCDLPELAALQASGFHYISTKAGQGVDSLLEALEERITIFFNGETAPMITRHRHRALLEETVLHIKKSLADIPLELKCEELRRAALAVGKITGKIQVDDVLDVVFSQFCIGK